MNCPIPWPLDTRVHYDMSPRGAEVFIFFNVLLNSFVWLVTTALDNAGLGCNIPSPSPDKETLPDLGTVFSSTPEHCSPPSVTCSCLVLPCFCTARWDESRMRETCSLLASSNAVWEALRCLPFLTSPRSALKPRLQCLPCQKAFPIMPSQNLLSLPLCHVALTQHLTTTRPASRTELPVCFPTCLSSGQVLRPEPMSHVPLRPCCPSQGRGSFGWCKLNY